MESENITLESLNEKLNIAVNKLNELDSKINNI